MFLSFCLISAAFFIYLFGIEDDIKITFIYFECKKYSFKLYINTYRNEKDNELNNLDAKACFLVCNFKLEEED